LRSAFCMCIVVALLCVVFVTEGEVVVRDPLTHAVENIGTTELHALLVELKSGRH
jgi:hypothetical protein